MLDVRFRVNTEPLLLIVVVSVKKFSEITIAMTFYAFQRMGFGMPCMHGARRRAGRSLAI